MSDTSHDASDDAALPGTPEWWATRPTPTTQPRRGRPPRSFERIVATATKLVEEVGPDAFSMRTLAEFAKTWESQCPAIVKLWEASWSEFVPFLNFDPEIRTIICTTDAIEAERLVPPGRESSRALPQRTSRPQVPLPGDPQPRPHRARTPALDQPLEEGTQRVRPHLRRTAQRPRR
jgi:hypothetical protein